MPDFSIRYFRIPLLRTAAEKARDSLTKAIYKFVFQHIVHTFNGDMNASLPYIGILDIAGFGEMNSI